MLIGGDRRTATGNAEIEVVNPATEEVIDTVPAGSPEDVELAVETAKRAFGEWSRVDVEKRAAVLARAHAGELPGTSEPFDNRVMTASTEKGARAPCGVRVREDFS